MKKYYIKESYKKYYIIRVMQNELLRLRIVAHLLLQKVAVFPSVVLVRSFPVDCAAFQVVLLVESMVCRKHVLHNDHVVFRPRYLRDISHVTSVILVT